MKKKSFIRILSYYLVLIIITTILTVNYGLNAFYDDLKVRYLGHIFLFSNQNYNWLFIGTSRTLTTINPVKLQEAIRLKYKKDSKILNLGLQHGSRYIDYKILKSYLKKHIPPEKIFIEVSNIERRIQAVPQYKVFSDIRDVYNDISKKLFHLNQFTLTCYYEAIFHGPQDLWIFIFERLNLYQSIDDFYKTQGYYEMNNFFNKWDAQLEREQLSVPEAKIISNEKLKHVIYYTNKINELCKLHNIELNFIFIPAYFERKLSDEQIDFYSKLGKIHFLDKSIYNKKYYRDPTHLNSLSSEVIIKSIINTDLLFK